MVGEQTPRYHRIADDLRGQIERGELKPGEQLPTEWVLTEQYSVSRNTVRLALRRLTEEQLIVAGQGRGSFVRKRLPRAVWDWSQLESRSKHTSDAKGDQWASIVAESGRQPRQEVTVSIRRPPAEVAQQLQLDPETALTVVRERVRLVDNEPYALADSYFPEELVRGTPLMLPEDVSAPGGVLASVGLIQSHYQDEITVRMPTRAETERLSLPTATPVAVHQRTGYDSDGRPLRVMITILPGDRHVIRYDVPAE
ncbi:GntR family transcriptional regulator [Allostreptomyces psammosilenae]|uniref:GntR family transcriptional regulator n=1 Tax=Allostreptomyces psammosilenae TaxID=1892865 RepID=A0A852ZT31_9ACTN|nr:GntR family transcriptional regulator [Allostreptomyces psammosilenae]NYI05563.1 GntR family transcriptional regulator [Allostreptomyces psammosilenae]